jgi:hypothetical protein
MIRGAGIFPCWLAMRNGILGKQAKRAIHQYGSDVTRKSFD